MRAEHRLDANAQYGHASCAFGHFGFDDVKFRSDAYAVLRDDEVRQPLRRLFFGLAVEAEESKVATRHSCKSARVGTSAKSRM